MIGGSVNLKGVDHYSSFLMLHFVLFFYHSDHHPKELRQCIQMYCEEYDHYALVTTVQ